MAAIDPTKPADGVAAVKGDLRANLLSAKTAIEPKLITDSATSITIDATDFGDAQLIVLRCTAATAVAVTGADTVPKGRMLMAIQKGAGAVTLQASTIVKPASVSFSTTEQQQCLVAIVEENANGLSAEWLLL